MVKTKIEVKVSRPGQRTITAELEAKSTVADLLEQEDITLASSEEAYVSDVKADMEDTLDDGDYVIIIGNKDGGLNKRSRKAVYVVVGYEDGDIKDEAAFFSLEEAQAEKSKFDKEYDRADIYKARRLKVECTVVEEN